MYKEEYYKMFEYENNYWWYKGLHHLTELYVKKFKYNKSNDLSVFDAGCGTGRLMEIMKKYGHVEGIDYSEDAIGLCKERNLNKAEKGDLNEWTSVKQSYDIITSMDVICTSGVEDDIDVLKKFHSSLKKDGILILNLPAFMLLRRDHDIAVYGKRRYKKKETLRVLEEIGFTDIYMNYRLPHLFIFILIQKFLLKPFIKQKEVTSDLKPLPKLINGLVFFLNKIENYLIKIKLPFLFGSSLFVVCKKTDI